jgi:hypothetical protein
MEEKEKIVVHFKEKIVTLHFDQFDADVDVDDLVRIHYDNLMGEILTISALLNRVGWLRAEAQDAVRRANLQLDIAEATAKENYRKGSLKQTTDYKGNPKYSYATKDEVDNSILKDENYIKLRERTLRIEKEYDYMDSLYWAVKSKDQKLNRIADNLKPEEFEREMIEGKINGIMIKFHKKLIS